MSVLPFLHGVGIMKSLLVMGVGGKGSEDGMFQYYSGE